MHGWLVDIARIAQDNNGLVTRRQLRDAGLRNTKITDLVAQGWLRRERRGVLGFAGTPRTWNQRLHAAVIASCGTASHSCAATLWAFRHLPYLTLELSVAPDRHLHLGGAFAHRVKLEPDDVCHTFGMPATTFERTLVDCTTVLSKFQLSANLDDGLRRGVASLSRLRTCVERLHSGPGRKLSVMHELLDQRPTGYHPGGSREERNVLDVLVSAGLPAPVQQFRVRTGRKTYFLDYAYPERRVYIEYYGTAWHGTPSAAVYDSARISDLSQDDWLPLIFTEDTPDHVMVEKVAGVLGLRPSSPRDRLVVSDSAA